MDDSYIDYSKLIDKAMQSVVKEVLIKTRDEGLLGNHHFFITFLTNAEGVMISKELKARYPHEMTIVIQHQYYDLEVNEDNFSIVLSFSHIKHNITVPFSAVTSFVDPSVKFGLQFQSLYMDDDLDIDDNYIEVDLVTGEEIIRERKDSNIFAQKNNGNNATIKDSNKANNSNIVDINSFRNKKDK